MPVPEPPRTAPSLEPSLGDGAAHPVGLGSQEYYESLPSLFYLCNVRMETLTIIGLVGNIVQFVDFSGKLISKSTEIYRSSEGALAENIDTEKATNSRILLNSRLTQEATVTGDSTVDNLRKS